MKKKFQQELLKNSANDVFSNDSLNKKEKKPCDVLTKKDVEREIAKYNWCHKINLGNGVFTEGSMDSRAFCLKQINLLDLKGKHVLDVGCRDGFYSLEAEKRGAKKVISIDIDISKGLREFLIPYFDSKIELKKESIYTFQSKEKFDFILFLGCLYHLKYPFLAFRKIGELLKDGGYVLIETAVYMDDNEREILYCPTKGGIKTTKNSKNGYGKRATTFFNHLGLIENLKPFGLEVVNIHPDIRGDRSITIGRDSFLCKKNESIIDEDHMGYYNGELKKNIYK